MGIEEAFDAAVEGWRDHLQAMWPEAMIAPQFKTPHVENIINLGEDALPLIKRELEAERDHPEEYGNFRAIGDYWYRIIEQMKPEFGTAVNAYKHETEHPYPGLRDFALSKLEEYCQALPTTDHTQ